MGGEEDRFEKLTVLYGHVLQARLDAVKINVMGISPAVQPRLSRDERRDHILDVARECFLKEGYAGCSMSTIAARLGGSKGTLYNYFPSKEELFEAFVRRACARFTDALSDAPPAGDDLRDRLVHFARAFLEHLLSPDAIAVQRLVIGEGDRFPELGPMFYAAGPRIIIGRMADELSALMADGRLRRADPVAAAIQFKDLSVSGMHHRRVECARDPDCRPVGRSGGLRGGHLPARLSAGLDHWGAAGGEGLSQLPRGRRIWTHPG